MLEVTESAQEKLSEYADKQSVIGTFRVYQSYG